MRATAADPAGFYEAHQAWPGETSGAIAGYLRSALARRPPRKCLFLGAATGVNDVLPFARRADPADRIIGSDVVPAYLDALRERAAREGLRRVEVRAIDIRRGLEALGTFDLVALFFVIHRVAEWREVAGPRAGIPSRASSVGTSSFCRSPSSRRSRALPSGPSGSSWWGSFGPRGRAISPGRSG